MEREIARNLIKDIPIPIIRPLPTLFYYGKYSNDNGSDHAYSLFKQSVEYLKKITKLLEIKTNNPDFNNITELLSKLINLENHNIEKSVIKISAMLSQFCKQEKDKIKNDPNFSKENLGKLYKTIVQPLNLLIIDNNNEPNRINKLSNHLINTGYYNVTMSKLKANNFIDLVKTADFLIFTSAYPITINDDVLNSQLYNKPIIILADLKKDKTKDQQTIRNGSWLQKKGFEVLYKIFTPLRLFTSIDKHYMAHYLDPK